jgi:hypothetical protein
LGYQNWDSSVVQCWVMGWIIGGSRPSSGWEFFSSPCTDRIWGPPSLISNGYQELFQWEQSDWSVKLTTHVHLVLRSRVCGAMPLFPNTPSWLSDQLKHRDSFTFTSFLILSSYLCLNLLSRLSLSSFPTDYLLTPRNSPTTEAVQSLRWSGNSLPLTESEGSLPCTRKTVIGPYS